MVTTRTNLAPCTPGSDASTEKLGLAIIERVRDGNALTKEKAGLTVSEWKTVSVTVSSASYYQEMGKLTLHFFRKHSTLFSDKNR